MAKICFSKSIFNVKNHLNLSKKNSVEKYQLSSNFFVFINFVKSHLRGPFGILDITVNLIVQYALSGKHRLYTRVHLKRRAVCA